MDLETWENEKPKQEIKLGEITLLIEKLKDAKADYEAAKATAQNAERFYKGIRMDVLSILKAAGQSRFHAEGIGSVSITNKLSVTVPKNHEDKEAMLEYFKEQGQDTFLTYATVNSMSLNSYFKLKTEEAAAKGETFNMPGVGEPTLVENISFRKG